MARMFKARLVKQNGYFPNEEREVFVLDMFVAVSNVAQVGNTVVSVQSEQQYEVTSIDEEAALIVGERVQDVSPIYGGEKVLRQAIYFLPKASIGSKLPAFLASGTRVDGGLTGEIRSGNGSIAEAIDLVVVVKDTHGNTYKKKVRVKHEESIDRTEYPLGEGVCPTIEVCSK